ncbi:rhomboid family intramembrane serine protease [Streptomyces sp. NPDC000410]|uniref:rhomboid family intramembrane serine protease n=1 Tax=Streptomyces sp. NPDC000410 TaxID=3154254 RepID=UPI00331A3247
MESAVTTCYRHPKVESHVRCTRCDRYICPDCMREASVGHQCVECVKEGLKSIRQARTAFGGRFTGASATVTYALIGLNLVAYLAELAVPALVDRFGMLGAGLVDSAGQRYYYEPGPLVGLGFEPVGVVAGEWYRLLTGAFLHLNAASSTFGIIHVVLNMFALKNLGPVVESQLGRARFVALYLLSALGGCVLVYLISPDDLVVGASGAIFGLGGAFYVISRRLNHDMRAVNRFMGGFLLWMLISAAFTSWEGHLGGLLAGGALTAAFAYAPQSRRTVLHAVACAGMLALLVTLVALKTSSLTAWAA